MATHKLGDFEYFVLTATAMHVDKGAYGAMLQHDIQALVGPQRYVSLGAVHTTLYRLEEKGFVTSCYGEPTPERGGRAKRYFKVSAQGRRILSDKEATHQNARALRLHGGTPVTV